ncbi:MAG: AAA family ATPase [Alistipes sp.]|nr:AAA family ATPase [Alistipes sp.]
MNKDEPVGSAVISAPTFNIAAMEADFQSLSSSVTKDLEIELREQRIVPFIIDITKPMAPVKPLLAIGGATVCSAGNISAIVGEAKSKKTFLTTALVASAFAYPFSDSLAFENVSYNPNLTVLWLDTEQSEAHVRKVIERINKMSGITRIGEEVDCRLTVLGLRELAPNERRDVLRDSLYVRHPDIVVIDGIADMMFNTNDIEEADNLIGELMALSTAYNCHIINVLHTNPGTDKARGHIGSSLQRKSESVIYVHRDNDISIAEPQFCRNEPFERFAFTVNDMGLPEMCSLPTELTSKEDEVCDIIRTYYGGSVERSVLANKLIETLGLGRTTASMRISRAVRKGILELDEQTKIVRLPSHIGAKVSHVTSSQACDDRVTVTPNVTNVTNVTTPHACDSVTCDNKFNQSNNSNYLNNYHYESKNTDNQDSGSATYRGDGEDFDAELDEDPFPDYDPYDYDYGDNDCGYSSYSCDYSCSPEDD